jgi:extracellular elastinolytic metalloproteinase
VTKGNNVDAYEDGDNSGFQPDAGASLDFIGYPFSEIYTNANQYESAAITNLFYWNNIFHDVLYQYGFDEAGGNFQENNYGNGGLGSDSVNAEAQDGSGTCNANFGTPTDGSNPTMQMYICNDKDGDFDNLVILHEYGHGVSNRLTGGPNTGGCLSNQEQMGEGWSDYYGVVMTIEPGDSGTDSRGVGTYLFGQGINGPGIRPFPYSTDLAVDPQTYDDIKTLVAPHGVGSVWATMMWEVTWALIDEYGWSPDLYNFTGDVTLDAGNVQAFAIITEGMKLQPCSPGFVDGRDAIFAADIAIYGGANECILWDAFAKRGLGVSADQGSSSSKNDGTEAFDTPSGIAAFTAPDDVCASSGILTDLGGGTPFGGVYSGPGVTDDGNGSTYSFDPAVAGVGVHTIGLIH